MVARLIATQPSPDAVDGKILSRYRPRSSIRLERSAAGTFSTSAFHARSSIKQIMRLLFQVGLILDNGLSGSGPFVRKFLSAESAGHCHAVPSGQAAKMGPLGSAGRADRCKAHPDRRWMGARQPRQPQCPERDNVQGSLATHLRAVGVEHGLHILRAGKKFVAPRFVHRGRDGGQGHNLVDL